MSCCKRINVYALLLALSSLLPLAAHELQANRLTMVLREPHHISMSFYLNADSVLHKLLGNKSGYSEFVLAYSALPSAQFEKEWTRAQALFQAQTRLQAKGKQALSAINWRWPAAAVMQASLQRIAMHMMVAPDEHSDEPPLQIDAEVSAQENLDSVVVHMPSAAQPLLVVSYRPQQRWLNDKQPAPRIAF